MQLSRLRAKQFVFVFTCALPMAGFVAAQALSLMPVNARPDAAARQQQSATSPTPAPATPPGEARTLPPQSRRRDMTRYEQAGPFTVPAAASPHERETVMAEARAFILAKWRARRLAHVSVGLPGDDGRPVKSAFYVERDEAGQWCVVLETVGNTQKFGFVEEVELAEDGPPILRPDDASTPRSGLRGIHLKESAAANSGVVF